ncbi:hypothetical protein ACTZWT_23640 [Rhodopseudomonas sp. NSM]|uniref:hypothetical protein n=1 Tax=Rhodopseudomonas sp. NSM TaxID=3457630 RepID=UPI0040366FE7
MRSNRSVKSNNFVLSATRSSALVVEFETGRAGASDRCRVKELEQENALLTSIVDETRQDIVRLRRLLIEP